MEDRIVSLLERIANAVERIADNTSSVKNEQVDNEQKPFPWRNVSVRCRKHIRHAAENDRYNFFRGKTWPLTCDDLQEIGFEELANSPIRNFGRKSALEISAIMHSLGYPDWPFE